MKVKSESPLPDERLTTDISFGIQIEQTTEFESSSSEQLLWSQGQSNGLKI